MNILLLKFFHNIGLTNLTDDQVEEYCSIKSNEIKPKLKEEFYYNLKKYHKLKYSLGYSISIVIALFGILQLMCFVKDDVHIPMLAESKIIKINLINENGEPLSKVYVRTTDGEKIPDSNGSFKILSNRLDNEIIICDQNDDHIITIATFKTIKNRLHKLNNEVITYDSNGSVIKISRKLSKNDNDFDFIIVVPKSKKMDLE